MIESPRKNYWFRRMIALFVLITFVPGNSFSAPSAPAEISASSSQKTLPKDLVKITLPEGLGKIQEIYQGPAGKTVILLQDAHAIPDAQRNIERIIEHFQQHYGLGAVGVEGSASELDPQIFKSFPDKEILKKTFENYFDQGELTGATAAAIFSKASSKTDFYGVEDWPLYESGLRLYLQAVEKSSELAQKIHVSKKALNEQKESVYSEKLLKVDRELERFYENPAHFAGVLKKLAALKTPEAGTDLARMLDEMKKEEAAPAVDQRPEALRRRSEQLERLRAMEGEKIFREFDAYVQSVKTQLFRNDAERTLDRESRHLDLLSKLVRLELSREEWEEAKKETRDRRHETSNLFPAARHLVPYMAFYQNAEKRDEAFYRNIQKILSKAASDSSFLLVAGGFHAQGMIRQLKANGVSYISLTPAIKTLPEHSAYREHMQGRVSWEKYFRVEKGAVDLYSAFVRAARDKLLGVTGDTRQVTEGMSPVTRNLSLIKLWRDQIILDLVKKNQTAKAPEYTRYLDEIASAESRPEWQIKLEKFIEGLRRLDTEARLTEPNVLKLFNPATMQAYAPANAIARQRIDAREVLAFSPTRSEMRIEPAALKIGTGKNFSIQGTGIEVGVLRTHSSDGVILGIEAPEGTSIVPLSGEKLLGFQETPGLRQGESVQIGDFTVTIATIGERWVDLKVSGPHEVTIIRSEARTEEPGQTPKKWGGWRTWLAVGIAALGLIIAGIFYGPSLFNTPVNPPEKKLTQEEEEALFKKSQDSRHDMEGFVKGYFERRKIRVENQGWLTGFAPWYVKARVEGSKANNTRSFREFEAEVREKTELWIQQGILVRTAPEPFQQKDLVTNPDTVRFLQDHFIGLGNYMSEGAGVHGPTGAPRDHVRVNAKGDIIGAGDYSSPAKDGVYLPALLHIYQKNPMALRIRMTPEKALDRMHAALVSIDAFQNNFEGSEVYAGLLPWQRYLDNGTRRLTKYDKRDMIPLLDNGQLTLGGLVVLAGEFGDAPAGSKEREVGDLAQRILSRQDYKKVIDPDTGRLFAEWDLEKRRGFDKEGHVLLWTEWAIPNLYAYLNGDITEKGWLNLHHETFTWQSPKGELDMPQMYRFGAPEDWIIQYLPQTIMKTKLAPLYRNVVYLNALWAIETNTPGFPGVEYRGDGVYAVSAPKMKGIRMMGSVDDIPMATAYGTAFKAAVHAPAVEWYRYYAEQRGMQTRFGPPVSFTRKFGVGDSPYFTGDGLGAFNALAERSVMNTGQKSGANHAILKHFARKWGVTPEAAEERIVAAFNLHADDILNKLGRKEFRGIDPKDIPGPPAKRDYSTAQFVPAEKMIQISGRLKLGDWHASNVAAPVKYADWGRPGQAWVAKDGEVIGDYSLADKNGKSFAFIGAYLNPGVPVLGYQSISFWIPAGLKDERWQIEIKNGDREIAARVDVISSNAVLLSKDGQWKRVVVRFNPLQIAVTENLQANYMAISTNLTITQGRQKGIFHFKDLQIHHETTDIIDKLHSDGPSGLIVPMKKQSRLELPDSGRSEMRAAQNHGDFLDNALFSLIHSFNLNNLDQEILATGIVPEISQKLSLVERRLETLYANNKGKPVLTFRGEQSLARSFEIYLHSKKEKNLTDPYVIDIPGSAFVLEVKVNHRRDLPDLQGAGSHSLREQIRFLTILNRLTGEGKQDDFVKWTGLDPRYFKAFRQVREEYRNEAKGQGRGDNDQMILMPQSGPNPAVTFQVFLDRLQKGLDQNGLGQDADNVLKTLKEKIYQFANLNDLQHELLVHAIQRGRVSREDALILLFLQQTNVGLVNEEIAKGIKENTRFMSLGEYSYGFQYNPGRAKRGGLFPAEKIGRDPETVLSRPYVRDFYPSQRYLPDRREGGIFYRDQANPFPTQLASINSVHDEIEEQAVTIEDLEHQLESVRYYTPAGEGSAFLKFFNAPFSGFSIPHLHYQGFLRRERKPTNFERAIAIPGALTEVGGHEKNVRIYRLDENVFKDKPRFPLRSALVIEGEKASETAEAVIQVLRRANADNTLPINAKSKFTYNLVLSDTGDKFRVYIFMKKIVLDPFNPASLLEPEVVVFSPEAGQREQAAALTAGIEEAKTRKDRKTYAALIQKGFQEGGVLFAGRPAGVELLDTLIFGHPDQAQAYQKLVANPDLQRHVIDELFKAIEYPDFEQLVQEIRSEARTDRERLPRQELLTKIKELGVRADGLAILRLLIEQIEFKAPHGSKIILKDYLSEESTGMSRVDLRSSPIKFESTYVKNNLRLIQALQSAYAQDGRLTREEVLEAFTQGFRKLSRDEMETQIEQFRAKKDAPGLFRFMRLQSGVRRTDIQLPKSKLFFPATLKRAFTQIAKVYDNEEPRRLAIGRAAEVLEEALTWGGLLFQSKSEVRETINLQNPFKRDVRLSSELGRKKAMEAMEFEEMAYKLTIYTGRTLFPYFVIKRGGELLSLFTANPMVAASDDFFILREHGGLEYVMLSRMTADDRAAFEKTKSELPEKTEKDFSEIQRGTPALAAPRQVNLPKEVTPEEFPAVFAELKTAKAANQPVTVTITRVITKTKYGEAERVVGYEVTFKGLSAFVPYSQGPRSQYSLDLDGLNRNLLGKEFSAIPGDLQNENRPVFSIKEAEMQAKKYPLPPAQTKKETPAAKQSPQGGLLGGATSLDDLKEMFGTKKKKRSEVRTEPAESEAEIRKRISELEKVHAANLEEFRKIPASEPRSPEEIALRQTLEKNIDALGGLYKKAYPEFLWTVREQALNAKYLVYQTERLREADVEVKLSIEKVLTGVRNEISIREDLVSNLKELIARSRRISLDVSEDLQRLADLRRDIKRNKKEEAELESKLAATIKEIEKKDQMLAHAKEMLDVLMNLFLDSHAKLSQPKTPEERRSEVRAGEPKSELRETAKGIVREFQQRGGEPDLVFQNRAAQIIVEAGVPKIIPELYAAEAEAIQSAKSKEDQGTARYITAIETLQQPVVIDYIVSEQDLSRMGKKSASILVNLLQAAHDAVAAKMQIVVRVTVPERVKHQLRLKDHNRRDRAEFKKLGNKITFFNPQLPSYKAHLTGSATITVADSITGAKGLVLLSDEFGDEETIAYDGREGAQTASRLFAAALMQAAESLSKKTFDALVPAENRADAFRVASQDALHSLGSVVRVMAQIRASLRIQQAA